MSTEDPRILGLRERRAQALVGGGVDRIARQHARGKQTARERLNDLFDPGTFHELGMFTTARGADEAERFAGDGVVAGFGLVDGRTVFAYAQDATCLLYTSPSPRD